MTEKFGMGCWNKIEPLRSPDVQDGLALVRLPANLRQESRLYVKGEQLPMCCMSG
jgi:hypothetical protein